MLDLVDHAPDRSGIFEVAGAANLIQAEANQSLSLVAFAANRAFGLRYFYS